MKYTEIANAILAKGHLEPLAAKQLIEDIESIAREAADCTTDDYMQLMKLWNEVEAKAIGYLEGMELEAV